jgi:hypothetical protein
VGFTFTVLLQFKLSNLEIKHIVFDKNAEKVKNSAIIRQKNGLKGAV